MKEDKFLRYEYEKNEFIDGLITTIISIILIGIALIPLIITHNNTVKNNENRHKEQTAIWEETKDRYTKYCKTIGEDFYVSLTSGGYRQNPTYFCTNKEGKVVSIPLEIL